MLHPSYSELMAVVNSEVEDGEQPIVQSRYSIVKATAARAKEIIDARTIEEKVRKARIEAENAPKEKGPRLAAACHGGVGTGAAHPVFAQLPGGGRHHRVRCGRDLQLQLVSGGRHDLPACRAGKDQLYLNAGAAFKPGAGPGESAQKPAAFAFAHRRAYGAHPYPGR